MSVGHCPIRLGGRGCWCRVTSDGTPSRVVRDGEGKISVPFTWNSSEGFLQVIASDYSQLLSNLFRKGTCQIAPLQVILSYRALQTFVAQFCQHLAKVEFHFLRVPGHTCILKLQYHGHFRTFPFSVTFPLCLGTIRTIAIKTLCKILNLYIFYYYSLPGYFKLIWIMFIHSSSLKSFVISVDKIYKYFTHIHHLLILGSIILLLHIDTVSGRILGLLIYYFVQSFHLSLWAHKNILYKIQKP